MFSDLRFECPSRKSLVFALLWYFGFITYFLFGEDVGLGLAIYNGILYGMAAGSIWGITFMAILIVRLLYRRGDGWGGGGPDEPDPEPAPDPDAGTTIDQLISETQNEPVGV